MSERITEDEIVFRHPFRVPQLEVDLPPGTYRITIEEQPIESLSFLAYRRVGTQLHIPAIGQMRNTMQYVTLPPGELEALKQQDDEKT